MIKKDLNFLENYKGIFWDFGGVIKLSNELKGGAFVDVFPEATIHQKQQILDYYNKNHGQSRYEKIPILLKEIIKIRSE